MEKEVAIRLEHITKTFGSVVANRDVSLDVCRGEILSLLGENGSGKTTLMNMISGIYFPDEGQIFVNGKAVTIRSPKDSIDLGIGMIHQHFKLVDVLTAGENIVLGLRESGKFDKKAINARVREISEKYGFNIDPDKKIYDMSVSEKQTVEIIKVLYRGADILILDEPTAVLTPQETEKLFDVLRAMRADGKAIIIITHKLQEVLELSDRVAVRHPQISERVHVELFTGACQRAYIQMYTPVFPLKDELKLRGIEYFTSPSRNSNAKRNNNKAHKRRGGGYRK